MLLCGLTAVAAENVDSVARPLLRYNAELDVWGSTGRFAPYYVMSNTAGRFISSDGAMLDVKAERALATEQRFEYGFGVEALAGYQRGVDYLRFNASTHNFDTHECAPAPIWLQQLWAGVKYRGVYLRAGMHERTSMLFNSRLGSGDLTLSGNARPVPRVSAGFIDFQNIPFTRGWVQICGEVSWGKFTDSHWLEDRFSQVNSFITTGAYMHYANCYFRTNPSQPFSVTVGMQHAAQFGGRVRNYREGQVTSERNDKPRFKDFVNALFPWTGGTSTSQGDQAYYDGNHLGSWDLRLRYRLHSGHTITAYMQSPYEDGSGIGKLNGFDGVWGLEYKAADHKALLSGAVIEYIDFTNQSGPMHWAPGDVPGTQVTSQATGADDYYNNFMYNGWANYGMALGSPFMKSPVYNTDGYMRFTDNKMRGFHAGAEGWIGSEIDWRALLGFRTSWGTPLEPSRERKSCTSMLLEAGWQVPAVSGLCLRGIIAWDAGSLIGNNFGAFLKISYSGKL